VIKNMEVGIWRPEVHL